MNKSEFIRKLADKQGVTIKEAESYFTAMVDTLTDCLKEGEYVHISGFATFELKEKGEREGVNPKTKEKIIIGSCKAPTVKFSKAYTDIFNA